LLLSAVGVPRNSVIEDYLLSGHFLEQNRRMILADPLGRSLANLAPEIWDPVLAADVRYIEAMFETIEQRHGSVPAYLAQELQVDGPMIDRLRAALVA